MSDDPPVRLDRCPVCNVQLQAHASGDLRCPPPKGCGRRFELRPFDGWERGLLPSVAGVAPGDLGAVSPTHTVVCPDGETRRVRVRP